MSAHTPGPWEACGWDVRTARTAEDGRGLVVATTEVSAFRESMHADARLIAAAPVLLAAAHRALVNHEDAGCSCEGCAKLRAAILLAEGRS